MSLAGKGLTQGGDQEVKCVFSSCVLTEGIGMTGRGDRSLFLLSRNRQSVSPPLSEQGICGFTPTNPCSGSCAREHGWPVAIAPTGHAQRVVRRAAGAPAMALKGAAIHIQRFSQGSHPVAVYVLELVGKWLKTAYFVTKSVDILP